MFGNDDIVESEETEEDLINLPINIVSHVKLFVKFVYMLLPCTAAAWYQLYQDTF